jgi:4'-phosphopantetheinyl transferase EntD
MKRKSVSYGILPDLKYGYEKQFKPKFSEHIKNLSNYNMKQKRELLRIAVIYKQVELVRRLLEKENVKPGYKKYIERDTDIKSKKILKILNKKSKSKSKKSFLLGRASLKKLCQRISISDDTSLIKFPNPNISLTHTKNYAIALALDESILFNGIGVDLELFRPLTKFHASYFLNEEEMKRINQEFVSSRLVQLWSIKEAVFKSDINYQEDDFKKYTINLNNLYANRKGAEFVFKTYDFLDNHYLSIALRKNLAT